MTKSHEVFVLASQLFVFYERRFQLWSLFISVSKNPIKSAVCCDQFRCGFFADTWNSRQVVTWVSSKRRISNVLLRSYSSSLKNSCLVIERIIRNSPLVIQNAHVWVSNELITIAVTSDDDDFVTDVDCLVSHGGDHIVSLKARQLTY